MVFSARESNTGRQVQTAGFFLLTVWNQLARAVRADARSNRSKLHNPKLKRRLMMAAIEEYLKAVADWKAWSKAADLMSATVQHGAKALESWRVAYVADGTGFPPEVMLSRNPDLEIDAANWPDAKRLSEVLRNYHEAMHKALDFYNAIPEPFRRGVQAPHQVT
jgi:hypothetical protein